MISADALIKKARHRAGLTQTDLARSARMSQPAIARLESREANPRVETLNRVIAATGHSLEVMLAPKSGIDETMIVADLRRSPDERLSGFESFYRSARELGGRARQSRGS